jgi:PAS domain S-box-containing protein
VSVVLVGAVLLQRQALQRQTAIVALGRAEARVAQIVEAAMDPIITVDDAQRIVLFNAAAEQVFQWPRSAVLGQRVDMLIPERFRANHAKHIERFGETGQTARRMGGQSIALMALRANGEEFPSTRRSRITAKAGRASTRSSCATSPSACARRCLSRSEARFTGHPRLGDGRDHHRGRAPAHRAVQRRRGSDVRCPQAEAIGAPLSSFLPERFRRRTPTTFAVSPRRASARGGWARFASSPASPAMAASS